MTAYISVSKHFSSLRTNETMDLDLDLDPSGSTIQYEEEISECFKHVNLKDKICMFETVDTDYYDKDSKKYARIMLMTESTLLEYLRKTDYGYFSPEGLSVLNIQNDGIYMYRRIFNPSDDIIKELSGPNANIASDVNLSIYVHNELMKVMHAGNS